jgi:hypothetical protein
LICVLAAPTDSTSGEGLVRVDLLGDEQWSSDAGGSR